ncbi:hypothetical protein CIB93_19370 [Streptomyces sp. WZ.A104]|uniref:PepSY domain-containing protein n=1 Tax=Streptomyces sp. WZ.A104 TaxID=2023771 RepID=UPI000BBBC5FD|nr:PepSY domain-containing protein [Streptomyces sp. WZ.A104]PCG84399.1 hypothetical protein CIB93_19370 [Streptomyces sp. WZ.A104]
MKRNATIAAITAAVLIGGTAAATVAFADDDGDRTPTRSAGMVSTADAPDDRTPAAKESARITLDQAVAAALKSVPGTVTEAELDDDDDDDDGRRGNVLRWDVDITGKDGKQHELRVDAKTGKVTVDRDDDDRDSRGGDADDRNDDRDDD